LKIALVTPSSYPSLRGNSVTVRRLQRELSRRGIEARVFSLEHPGDTAAAVAAFRPTVVHAFHALRGGRIARRISGETGIPYLVTLTGTDVYESLAGAEREETLEILSEGAAVVVFHEAIREEIRRHSPLQADRTEIVPQGVAPLAASGPPPFTIPDDDVLFLLPAGIRPVKDVFFPLEPLARLRSSGRRPFFLLAGPVLDQTYGAGLSGMETRHPFARYAGVVPRGKMGSLYRRADVVLNTSLFEGGMANSLLEAMVLGCAVLASDIPGNRSLVEDGKTGLLYRDGEDFIRQAERLASDPELRRFLGENGRRVVRESYVPEMEGERYLEIYRRVAG
jgi:L-malate glycosyltransferase